MSLMSQPRVRRMASMAVLFSAAAASIATSRSGPGAPVLASGSADGPSVELRPGEAIFFEIEAATVLPEVADLDFMSILEVSINTDELAHFAVESCDRSINEMHPVDSFALGTLDGWLDDCVPGEVCLRTACLALEASIDSPAPVHIVWSTKAFVESNDFLDEDEIPPPTSDVLMSITIYEPAIGWDIPEMEAAWAE